MRVFRVVAFNLLAILVLLGIFEAVFALNPQTRSEKANYFSERAAKITSAPEEILGRFNSSLEIAMPFFGYGIDHPEDLEWHGLYNRGSFKINNYKFRSSLDYPYIKKADEVVIGVFGGSFAFNWVVYENSVGVFAQKLPGLIPKLKNKRIVLVNMSQGGFKQPQQFIVLAYFLEMFDAAIFIDGYNEITHTALPEFPLEFPLYSAKFYAMSGARNEFRTRMAQSTRTLRQSLLNIISLQFRHPWLSRSYLYYAFDSAMTRHLKNKIVANNILLNSDARSKAGKFYREDFDAFDNFHLAAGIWEKYTALSHDLAKKDNLKMFHFVQPNQYLGLKPLSEYERKNSFLREKQSPAQQGFAVLLKSRKALEKRKYRISTKLMEAFENVTDDLYIDTCCHVNDAGNAILTTKLLTLVSKDW